MAVKILSMRIQLENGQVVEREIRDIGNEGEKALRKIKIGSEEASNGLKGLASNASLAKGASIALAAGVAAFAALKNTTQALSGIGDAADRIGISAERLQELRYAADQNASSAESMDNALQQLSIRLGKAVQDGASPAAAAFSRLGISLKEAGGETKDTGVVFDEIIQKLPLVASHGEQAALATQLMGKTAADLVPLLAAGSSGIQDSIENLRQFGAVIDEAGIRKAQELQDKFDQVTLVVSRTLQRLVVSTAEVFNILPDSAAEKYEKADQEFQKSSKKLNKSYDELVKVNSSQASNAFVGFFRQKRASVLKAEIAATKKDMEESSRELLAAAAEIKNKKEKESAINALQKKFEQSPPSVSSAGRSGERPTSLQRIRVQAAQRISSSVPKRSDFEETLTSLRFEEAQLGRTSQQQRIYNELKKASVSIDSMRGQAIKNMVERLEAQEKLNELMEQGKQITESLQSGEELLAARFSNLNRLFRDGAISAETFSRGTKKINEELWMLDKKTEETNRFAEDLGLTFSSAFEDAVVGGKKFSEVLGGIAQDLTRLIVRQAVTEPLGSAFKDLIGNTIKGISFGGSSAAQGGVQIGDAGNAYTTPGGATFSFGGARADGGAVSVGKAYLVGEKGPELFLPQASGSIIPNGSSSTKTSASLMPGSGAVVQIIDQRGQSAPPAEVQQQQQPDGRQLIRVIISEVASDIRNRGQVGRAIEGTFGAQRSVATR